MAALLQSIDQPKDAGPGLKTKPIAYLGERWGDAARCLLIGVDISEGFKLARGHSNAPADRKGEVSRDARGGRGGKGVHAARSEEQTSELQSLMRISYAVFCLKKKQQDKNTKTVRQRT